jgi:ketosteroid isomerase-like protein
MMRSILLTLTTVVLLAGNTSFAASAPSAVDEVRTTRAAWNDAYNIGDVNRLIALYTEDAVSRAPGIPVTVGRPAIKTDLGMFLADNKVHETTQIQDIMIQGDLAVERANYVAQITPRKGKPFTERGKHIVAYRCGPDGQRRVKWEIWNSDAPEQK